METSKVNKITQALKASCINKKNKIALLSTALIASLAAPVYATEEDSKIEVDNNKSEVIEVKKAYNSLEAAQVTPRGSGTITDYSFSDRKFLVSVSSRLRIQVSS